MQFSVLLDAALRCLTEIENVDRAIEHFFCFRCCRTLLGEMLDSYDHCIELARLAHAQLTLLHSIIELYIVQYI